LTWLDLILGALATFRITSLFVSEEGPFAIFERLRRWAGTYELGPSGQPQRALGRFLDCFWCVSVWIGFLFSLLLVRGGLEEIFAAGLAMSALACVLWEVL